MQSFRKIYLLVMKLDGLIFCKRPLLKISGKDKTANFRSGSSVVDKRLDYESRGHKIDPPATLVFQMRL